MNPQLEAFDTWFRHAETIGQHRLYNFLMTGSVILIACAGVLNLQSKHLGASLAIVLAVFGFVLSLLWLVLGRRQVKFHRYIQCLADRTINGLPEDQQRLHAFYWVRRLQEGRLDQTDPTGCRLNNVEVQFSSRFFLWFVPLLFAVAYVAMFCGGLWLLAQP